jgi:hypothetical protein
MYRVISAPDARVHVSDFPLHFLGDLVGDRDAVGEEERVPGFFQDGRFHYHVCRVSGHQFVDCLREVLVPGLLAEIAGGSRDVGSRPYLVHFLVCELRTLPIWRHPFQYLRSGTLPLGHIFRQETPLPNSIRSASAFRDLF